MDGMDVIWEDEVETPSQSESLHRLTAKIIQEIVQIVCGRRRCQRKDTLVYQIVSGGNVDVIRAVFCTLKADKRQRELSWLVGSSAERCQEKLPTYSCTKVLLFLALHVVFVLATPLFYVFHAITNQWFKSRRKRIHKHMDLPLLFALISEDMDMIKLFLENGCRISSQDRNGNNIYHYLADLSSEQPDKAFRCHEKIIELVNDVSHLKKVIMSSENHNRLTPFECMAKYGSLALFKHISMDQCGLGSRILTVSEDRLWAKLPAEHWTQVNNSSPNVMRKNIFQEDHKHPAIIDVWEFNVERYDTGEVTRRQSYPLQILTSRSVENLPREDAKSLLNFTLLWKWMKLKVRTYVGPCILAHLLNLSLTVILLWFVIMHGGDMNTSPLAAPANTEYISEVHRLAILIAAENESLPEANTTLKAFAKDTLGIDSCVLASDRNSTFARPDLLSPNIDNCLFDIISAIQDKCTDLNLEELIENMRNAHVQPTSTVTLDFLIRTTIFIFIGVSVVLDFVIRGVFLSVNFNWHATNVYSCVYLVLSQSIPGSYIEKQLSLTTFSLYGMAVFTGYQYRRSVRLLQLYYDIYKQSLQQQDSMILRDYLGQIGIHIMKQRNDISLLESLWGTLLVLCLLLRFLVLIHSLRLIPGVGFFVITATKMAKHLAQFTVIFAFVSLSYATVFYFVMKNPECPARKLDSFSCLGTSMFTIYQVFLGYGEYDFSANINARLAYIAYTVTSVILLLNLVIAVMTTTVEELNRAPWKEVLLIFETWDEILGTEVALLTLLMPFRYLFRRAMKVLDMTEDIKTGRTFEIVCWSRFDAMNSTVH